VDNFWLRGQENSPQEIGYLTRRIQVDLRDVDRLIEQVKIPTANGELAGRNGGSTTTLIF